MTYLVAFFNLSGRVPDPEDFEGLSDKSERERREMGLQPREDLIDGLDFIPFEPPKYICQIEAVPKPPRNRIWQAKPEFPHAAWLTHVGVLSFGRLYVKAITPIVPVREGLRLDFGFTDDELPMWKTDRGTVLECGSAWAESTMVEIRYDHTRQIDLEDA